MSILYIYIYTCICLRIHVHICIHVYICIYMFMHVYICIYICIYNYIHICIYTHYIYILQSAIYSAAQIVTIHIITRSNIDIALGTSEQGTPSKVLAYACQQ